MVPRPATSMLLCARALAVDHSHRILALEWLRGMCYKSPVVSRTPAGIFTFSPLRLFDSNFFVPTQIKTPRPLKCTLMVAQVSIGDVYSI